MSEMADSNPTGTGPGADEVVPVEVEVKKKRGRISNAEKLRRQQLQEQQNQASSVKTPDNASLESPMVWRNLRNSSRSELLAESISKQGQSTNDGKVDGQEKTLVSNDVKIDGLKNMSVSNIDRIDTNVGLKNKSVSNDRKPAENDGLRSKSVSNDRKPAENDGLRNKSFTWDKKPEENDGLRNTSISIVVKKPSSADSDETESVFSEYSVTSKRRSGKRFRLSKLFVPAIMKVTPKNMIETSFPDKTEARNSTPSKNLIVFNPNISNSDLDLTPTKAEPVSSRSIADDNGPESSEPKTEMISEQKFEDHSLSESVSFLPKKRGRKPKNVSNVKNVEPVDQTSSKEEKEESMQTRGRRSGLRTESPLTRKGLVDMKSQPKPEASLQPNSDTNVEAKDQVKAEAQNDAKLSKDDSANRSSKPENDLEIPGEPKLTTPIVEKKRRGRKPAASQNKSETNKTVLNHDISSIEKSNPNETSEINEESGSNDRILITPTEVQKTRKKIDLKATSQVTADDHESPSDDVTKRKCTRGRKRKSGNLVAVHQDQPISKDEENGEAKNLDDPQKTDLTQGSNPEIWSSTETTKRPKTSLASRTSTPEVGNQMFEDDFEDIPQLQISPKVNKATIFTPNSPEKANMIVPTRIRSLRKKAVINYALLQDGISMSDSSDVPENVSAGRVEPENVSAGRVEPENVSAGRVEPEIVAEETRLMKRRVSESSSDSIPLSVLKSKSKKRKQNSEIGNDVDQSESYVNLQVSNMKAALDSAREEQKESESRNLELEQKLIGLTETNLDLEKEYKSVSYNAANLEKELTALKKRYETDLEELEKTKTNLVTLYNGIQSKSSEMSQMKICSERILLESNKLKKDLEISKKNIESLDAFKSHFLSVRSSLENTFRTDDESNKIRTNFESLSDAQVSEIVSELLADYVELKNQFSIEVKNNIEKMEAKNEEFKNAKNQTLKEEEKKLSELRVKIHELKETVEDLKATNSSLELCAIEVEHLKMDRSQNLQKLQDLRKELNSKEAENVSTVKKINAEMEAMKGQFKASFSEKDRQITQLNARLREKDIELAQIKTDSETKTTKIQQLESELSSIREAKSRDASSRQKELDEICWARAHVLEMDKKVENLEQQIKKEKELNQSCLKNSEQRENEHKEKLNGLVLEVQDREEKLKRTEKALKKLAEVNKMAAEEVTAERKTNVDSTKNLEELKTMCQTEVRKLEDMLRDKDDEIESLKKTLVDYSLKLDVENLVRGESQIIDSQNLELQTIESQDLEAHNIESQNLELQNIESQNIELQNIELPNIETQDFDSQDFELQDFGEVLTSVDPSEENLVEFVDSADGPMFPVLSCNFDLVDQNDIDE